MKKVSNKYVNYGIAFALFGILVFSLVMTPLEGFKEGVDKNKKAIPALKKPTVPTAKKPPTSAQLMAKVNEATKKVMAVQNANPSASKEGFSDIKETLAQLQDLAHLVKEDEEDTDKSKVV